MANKIEEIGGSILDFIDVTIDSIGSNIRTSSDEKEAKVALLDATAQKIRIDAEIKKNREEKLLGILSSLLVIVAVLASVAIIGRLVTPFFKR